MKKIIIGFVVLCFFAGAPSQVFTVTDQGFFGKKQVEIAKAAAAHWTKLYGCGTSVVLSPLRNPDENEIERAFSGHIYYTGQGDIKSVVLHSMTHAVKPEKPAMLAKTFLLGRDTVIGFHGLSLIVKLRGGGKTQFTKIEEGVAERAAIFAGLGYESYSYHYVNLTTLTKNRFPKGYSPEPVNFVKTNDVYGYAAEFLGKKKGDVDSSDAVRVVNSYQRAWDAEALIPERGIY